MQKIMFNDKYGLTKAVLEGRKTMTRRMVKGEPLAYIIGGMPGMAVMEAPYKVGEVVAVAQPYSHIFAEADLQQRKGSLGDLITGAGWENKMFVQAKVMPHKIRITNVRVERLQDISDEDSLREGIQKDGDTYWYKDSEGFMTARWAFAALFDDISGKSTWNYNPWVFVYEFELV